jgi:hypothetical protein
MSDCSLYLKSPKKKARNPRKLFLAIVTFALAAIVGLLSVGTAIVSTQEQKASQAQAFDPYQWFMCFWGKDSIPTMIYQYTQTSDLQYMVYSKSSINLGLDKVDQGLNAPLDFFGVKFKDVNESILGYSLDTIDGSEEGAAKTDTSNAASKFNTGPKVNPYDRFGVAGLNFTAYAGEWKYFTVDACASDSNVTDPKAGLYYNNRLEPQSVWESIDSSKDVRTQVFSKAFLPTLGKAFVILLANLVFTITKFMVVTTLTFINFAFSDITEVFGINKLIAGDGKSKGMFGLLFDNLFTPLVVLMFILTGARMFWHGIIKAQYRESFSEFVRTIALFVIAIIISINPLTFVALPNNIATVAQAVILTSVSNGLAGGEGLCKSDASELLDNKGGDISTADGARKLLAKASQDMQSAVGCSFWQMFLLKPWAQGQWGADWTQVWAKGKTGDLTGAAQSKSGELDNDNEDQVGDAAVPVGNGEFVNNWAIFQISTQTNAHSMIGSDGKVGRFTSGVSNDWWRIVDATSNYQEENITETASGFGTQDDGNDTDITYTEPKSTKVTPYWSHWIGNASGATLSTAISSVVVAVVGLMGPFIFGLLSAIYSIGIALIMAFAPIMFLLCCWAGRGWEMFKGWAELVVNTTLKRIVTGVLLVLSISFSATAINMMESIGWWQGIMMMVLMSVLLIKSRDKIINALASIRFASVDFGSTASRLYQKSKSATKTVGRTGAGAAVGGITAKRAGGSFKDGVKSGIKTELKAKVASSNSSFVQSANLQYKTDRANSTGELEDLEAGMHCNECGIDLSDETRVGAKIDGTYLCGDCYDELRPDDAREVFLNGRKIQEYKKFEKEENDIRERQAKAYEKGRKEYISSKKNRDTSFEEAEQFRKIHEGKFEDNEDPKELALELADNIYEDINKAKDSISGVSMDIPEELKGYFPNVDNIYKSFQEGNYEYIREMYSQALMMWLQENAKEQVSVTIDEIRERAQGIHSQSEDKTEQ